MEATIKHKKTIIIHLLFLVNLLLLGYLSIFWQRPLPLKMFLFITMVACIFGWDTFYRYRKTLKHTENGIMAIIMLVGLNVLFYLDHFWLSP